MKIDGIDFDEIDYWSELKQEIIKKYVKAYLTIMKTQKAKFHTIYIDAFSGAGEHYSKKQNQIVEGSPLQVLNLNQKFNEYHFIDLDGKKIEHLRQVTEDNPNVSSYNADCNNLLLEKIFPTCLWKNYYRALCILDPYGLHLNWEVIQMAAKEKTIEIFLNFHTMDMNRNVLRKEYESTSPIQQERMNKFWGDESWKEGIYQLDLFGTPTKDKVNKEVASLFQKRLKEKAGFKYVPDPMPMRNSKGAIIYYLYFASHNHTGENIVEDIFNKYKNEGIK